MNKNYFKLFMTTLILMPIATYAICNNFSFPEEFIFLLTIINLAMIISTLAFAIDPTLSKPDEPVAAPFRVFKNILILVFILSLVPIKQPKEFYNTSIVTYNDYQQKTQQKKPYYDKMYKSFMQKKDIAFINQEQFTLITSIIMENKKDGAQLAWKWLSEQKLIPFEEFSSFWRDLSAFVETQREGYYALEVECQQLANRHNILLSTFPNNFYNWFFSRPYAHYELGFSSNITEEVFLTRRENF